MSIEKMLRWIVLVGIFALPFIVLIVSRSLFFPFITGKNFTFRIIVEVIGGAWLALGAVNSAYRPRRSWILYALLAWVIVIGIADTFGVNPFKSIWSNFERMEGWVTLVHLFIYFCAAVSVLDTEKLWRYFWHTSLCVSVLVSCYGLLQLAGFATINQGGVRLDATLGNATYLAIYMLFHVFIASLLLAQMWVERGAGKRLMPGLLYGGIIVLDTFILFFTATRGAILGLIGGAICGAAVMVLLSPRSRIAWRAGVGVAIVIALGIGLFAMRDTALIQRIEPLQRLTTMSLTETTVASRFTNWSMAWQGVKERPILGWGQENFAVVFDKYYDPQMYAQEPWFDRVHEIFLDWLVAGGILGLLAYLSIYAAALWVLWRSGAFAPYERAILTGLFAGYIFYNLFTFDNILSYILFISLLAFIATRASREGMPVFKNFAVPKSALPIVAGVAVLFTWSGAWFVNSHALAANREIIAGLSPHGGDYSQNLEYFKKAISYQTYGTQEAREHLLQVTSQVIQASFQAPADVKQAFLQTTAAEMQKQMQEAPLNARFPFFLGSLLDAAGDYPDAKPILDRAHTLSPNKQSILFEVGLNALARGDSAASLASFETAYKLAPQYTDAKIFYVAAGIRTGNDARVADLLKQLMDDGQAADPRIFSAYAARNQYDKIAEVLEARIAKQPKDIQARLSLAAAYYKVGNTARSLKVLEDAKNVTSDSAIQAQIDSLIKEVKHGTLKVN